MKLSQTASIDKSVDHFEITSTSPVPACSFLGLKARQEGKEAYMERHREAVGGPFWPVNTTRPDISCVGREITRSAEDPSEKHWGAVIKTTQYLKGARQLDLISRKAGRYQLDASAGASDAENKKDGRSVSGTVVMLGGAALSWSSKTQACVTLSQGEAGYMSLTDCTKDALFLRMFLRFLRSYVVTHVV